MKQKVLSLILVLFITITSQANNNDDDWGPTGHRAIGKIAENHLKKSVKRKIEKLLQGESLAFVSTYADEIKSDRNYNKYYSWHYVNFPLDGTYETSKKNPKGDIITGIEHCVKVLKDDNAKIEDKRFFLKMLVHLIGDLHQPLHIGRQEDKGGNTIQVRWFNKGTNLHRVWDENMIEEYNMGYNELAENADILTKKQVKFLQQGSIIDWVNETHQLTKKVYESAKPDENLRYRYSYLHFNTVRKQLQIGGIRLAKGLNDLF